MLFPSCMYHAGTKAQARQNIARREADASRRVSLRERIVNCDRRRVYNRNESISPQSHRTLAHSQEARVAFCHIGQGCLNILNVRAKDDYRIAAGASNLKPILFQVWRLPRAARLHLSYERKQCASFTPCIPISS